MRKVSQAFLFALTAATLSACFESRQSLIKDSESAAPVKPGVYVSSSEPDKLFKIAIRGAVTDVTVTDADGKAQVSTYLLRRLRGDYFIVMDRSNFRYGLIGVDHQQIITSYTSSLSEDHCAQLEELAFSKDVPLSHYGVSELDNGDCYFASFDKLALAFGALLDADRLKVDAIYRPKELKAGKESMAPTEHPAPLALNDLGGLLNELNRRGLPVARILEVLRNDGGGTRNGPAGKSPDNPH